MEVFVLVCHACKTWVHLGLHDPDVGDVVPEQATAYLFKAEAAGFLTAHVGCEIRLERHGRYYDGQPEDLDDMSDFVESPSYRKLRQAKPDAWYVKVIDSAYPNPA
jgi:hypothetical protein